RSRPRSGATTNPRPSRRRPADPASARAGPLRAERARVGVLHERERHRHVALEERGAEAPGHGAELVRELGVAERLRERELPADLGEARPGAGGARARAPAGPVEELPALAVAGGGEREQPELPLERRRAGAPELGDERLG